MTILQLVVGLLIAGVILWAVMALPVIDATVKKIIYVVVVVATVIWLLQGTGLLSGHLNIR